MTFHVPERFRVKKGRMASQSQDGNNGLFFIPIIPTARNANIFCVVATDGAGWEHVSVSLPNRCPTWSEMCKIKEMFWDDDDCVIQYHPPKSDWVNNHQYCLHLWRPIGAAIPRPPAELVGIAALGVLK